MKKICLKKDLYYHVRITTVKLRLASWYFPIQIETFINSIIIKADVLSVPSSSMWMYGSKNDAHI